MNVNLIAVTANIKVAYIHSLHTNMAVKMDICWMQLETTVQVTVPK